MISRRELVLAGLLAATPGPTNADALAGVAGVGPSLYLRELAELQSRLSADATDLANRQQLAQVLAMTGDQRAADAVWMGPRRMAQSTGSRIAATALANTFAEDAVSAIEREARKSRIVILNEAHHVSRCRAFGEVIALRLRRLGFNRLALEALAVGASTKTNGPSSPITADTGYFIRDPVFAQFLRHAREVGYQFWDYEAEQAKLAPYSDRPIEEQIGAREAAQAESLARLVRSDPGSRVLIYCGFSHASERVDGRLKWMAARLRDLTGVDPVTVDQTSGFPPPGAGFGSLGELVVQHHAPKAPIAVYHQSGKALGVDEFNGAVDLAIYHPASDQPSSATGWLASLPGRRAVQFAPELQIRETSLLQAVPIEEATRSPFAIPADQFFINPGQRRRPFYLRPGEYVVVLEQSNGRSILGTLSAPG